MRSFRVFLRRIAGLFRQQQRDRELAEEIESNLQLQIADKVRSGMMPEQARRQALIELGGLEQTKEAYRKQRGVPFIEGFLQDVRYAIRVIRKNPGFASVAALTLALGIGANSAIFSLADALLLRPLPVLEPNAVVTISTDPPDGGVGGISYPDYRDFRDKAHSFDGMIAFEYANFSLARSAAETPQMRFGILVSDNYFKVLGVQPVLGRALLADEGQAPGRDPVVVLAYDFWRSEFFADRAILNRTVRINGIEFTVIGVAPKEFTSTDEYVHPYFYVPLNMEQRLQGLQKDPLQDRSHRSLEVKGRLKAGITRKRAQAELATIWKDLERLHSEADGRRAVRVRTELQQRIESSPDDAYLIALLLALTGVVLMIACANVANLLLGRARARTREIAIRLALGVSRPRLVRQLLTESMALALLGVVLGWGFAYGGIQFLQTIRIPSDIPAVIAPQLDVRVLLFGLILGVASAILFGLAPALQASKTSLTSALKNADAARSARHRMFGRNTLVVVQLALSMVLLVAASMLLDGFRRSLVLDPGFRTRNILTAQFDTSLVHYTPQQTHDFYRTLRDRLAALPGVRAITFTTYVPFTPQQRMEAVLPEGYKFPEGQLLARILCGSVDENYFALMETRLLRGRAFTSTDKEGEPLVAIVNLEFARRYWPNQDAIGKRLRIASKGDKWLQVVGIVQTGRYTFPGEPPTPFIYVPLAQNEVSSVAVLLDTVPDPGSLAAPVRDVAHSLDPDQPVFNLRTLSDVYSQRAVVIRIIMEIVASMGVIGLSLALIGLYALVAYSVARRTREIGVRIAIGANQSDVLKMVLRQGLVLAVTGIASGGVISVAVARLITAGLVGLGRPNSATYIVVPVVLLVVTLFSCYIPARRAARVDPMAALRYE